MRVRASAVNWGTRPEKRFAQLLRGENLFELACFKSALGRTGSGELCGQFL
jgi:hypothetical protein